MGFRLAADAVLVLHLAFVVFVALGGILVVFRPRLAWIHLPAAVWGALIELAGWICPLTPLENRLRAAAGTDGYAGGFIEHYLTAAIYPTGLTRPVQVVIGLAVIVWTVAVYSIAIRRHASDRRRAG